MPEPGRRLRRRSKKLRQFIDGAAKNGLPFDERQRSRAPTKYCHRSHAIGAGSLAPGPPRRDRPATSEQSPGASPGCALQDGYGRYVWVPLSRLHRRIGRSRTYVKTSPASRAISLALQFSARGGVKPRLRNFIAKRDQRVQRRAQGGTDYNMNRPFDPIAASCDWNKCPASPGSCHPGTKALAASGSSVA